MEDNSNSKWIPRDGGITCFGMLATVPVYKILYSHGSSVHSAGLKKIQRLEVLIDEIAMETYSPIIHVVIVDETMESIQRDDDLLFCCKVACTDVVRVVVVG